MKFLMGGGVIPAEYTPLAVMICIFLEAQLWTRKKQTAPIFEAIDGHRASIDGMEILVSALEVDVGEAPQMELQARRARLRAKTTQVLLALENLPHWGRVGGARRVEIGRATSIQQDLNLL